MVRLLRPLAIVLAIAPSGCFVDENGEASGEASGSEGTSTGASASTTPVSGSTTDLGSDASSEDASGTTQAEDGTTSTTGPGPDTDDSTDASTGSSSSSSTGDEGILTVEELAIGDLVITEMMGNPNCTADNCEWFEVLNTTEFPIDLHGLGIGDVDAIAAELPDAYVLEHAILEPGTLGVFARQELWPYDDAVEPLVRYPSSVALSNGEFDTIGLFGANDLLLDEAAIFLGNNETAGRSRKLRAAFWNVDDNDDGVNWCWSNTPLPSSSTSDDWGTPGFDERDCLTGA